MKSARKYLQALNAIWFRLRGELSFFSETGEAFGGDDSLASQATQTGWLATISTVSAPQ
jgi:hypothetical protein